MNPSDFGPVRFERKQGPTPIPPARAAWIDLWRTSPLRADLDELYLDPIVEEILDDLLALPSGGTVIDLGCGLGEKTEMLRRMGLRATGIDRNEERVRIAGQRFPLAHFVVGDIQDLPFPPTSFDAIFSKGVLQYVSWRETIRGYAALLRPGGRAIFIENLGGNPFSRAYRLVHRWRRWEYGSFLNPKEHLQWNRLEAFTEAFADVRFRAFNLITPLALLLPGRLAGGFRNGVFAVSARDRGSRGHRLLQRADDLLLRAAPQTSRFCWTVLIRARKVDRADASPPSCGQGPGIGSRELPAQ
jgi:SAM-dependent methyltransferase